MSESRAFGPLAALLLVLRFAMAAVFIAAALPKIAAPDLFAGNVFNYKMLPPWGVNTLALVLPWLELLIGLGLLLGVWARASAVTMAALMVIFITAYVTARARGLDISCGCFAVGEGAEHASPVWIVLRDVAMLGATLLLVRYGTGPRLLSLFRRVTRRAPASAH
jgi:uncharacterized membrane protein YphA (DoxX/SURF4 family)